MVTLINPLKNDSYVITQKFGENPQIYSKYGLRGHNGIDYAAPMGTAVYAAAEGVVGRIGFENDGYGLYVRLNHTWGKTIYAHLNNVLVKINSKVAKGELIAFSDNSGFSTGAHLHFEVRMNGQEGNGYNGAVDPLQYIVAANEEIQAHEYKAEDYGLAVATVYQLRLRIAPNVGSNVIGYIPQGFVFGWLDKVEDEEGNLWLKISYNVYASARYKGVDNVRLLL